jgi:hypothetical protein
MNARRTDGVSRVNNAGRSVTDSRKQAVSIRMSRGDVRQIKQLADRLGVRDSDVIRYAIKIMLSRLAPLPDGTVKGRALLPVFVEAGAELMHHFELDATRLAEIINDGADPSHKVDAGDIQLIAMSGTQAPYARMRFAAIGRGQAIERAHLVQVNGTGQARDGAGGSVAEHVRNGVRTHAPEHAGEDRPAGLAEQSLRQYIYEKYLYAHAADLAGGETNGA